MKSKKPKPIKCRLFAMVNARNNEIITAGDSLKALEAVRAVFMGFKTRIVRGRFVEDAPKAKKRGKP
jgi:hypothetical protein